MTRMHYPLVWIFLMPWMPLMYAQVPLNDDCNRAYVLPNIINTTYEGPNFTNVNANPEAADLTCFTSFQSDAVWYYFVAITRYVRIIVEGRQDNNNLTLNNLVGAVYAGDCSNLTEQVCKSSITANLIEMILPTTPGETYYIAVGGQNGSQGSFRIYIDAFNADPEPTQDCTNGTVLCDKSPIDIQNVAGFGREQEDLALFTNPAIAYAACGVTENASMWFRWTCKESGTLTFTITPYKQYDDIDFLLYELPGGIDDCSNKQLLRNMISGQNLNAPFNDWKVCVGPTGLKEGDPDDGESCGCQPGDNNFASALQMEAGKSYALLVMNFSQSGLGFRIEFGGSGTFKGPEAKFEVQPDTGLRCDQSFVIKDLSTAASNNLEYNWYFGSGANPQTSTDRGPFNIEYSTWGEKYIVLTLREPESGCEVTTIKKIFAEPCCEDLPPLQTTPVIVKQPNCPWSGDGAIVLQSSQGAGPPYQYSIDGSPFISSSEIPNLPAGTYQIITTDPKGCMDTIEVTVTAPDSVFVDAGRDTTITLGENVRLHGYVDPMGHTVQIKWTPTEPILDCTECLDPEVFVKNQTTFTLTVTDENGCVYEDIVVVRIDIDYPLFIPNAFTPNGDGINDIFTAFSSRAVERIDELIIYDRWGGVLFHSSANNSNEPYLGWDGRTPDGRFAMPGVYVYLMKVRFIDGSVRTYSGDITLIR